MNWHELSKGPLSWLGLEQLPWWAGEAEGPGHAQPGERQLCRSLTAASQPTGRQLRRWSQVLQRCMARGCGTASISWNERIRLDTRKIILLMSTVDSGAGCPERLSNLCPVRNLSQDLINKLAGQKQQQTINQWPLSSETQYASLCLAAPISEQAFQEWCPKPCKCE